MNDWDGDGWDDDDDGYGEGWADDTESVMSGDLEHWMEHGGDEESDDDED